MGRRCIGLDGVDNQSGILYFPTGHPSETYDASLTPGPNLYSDSIIALNATTSRMVWFYQFNLHEVTERKGGWRVTLATMFGERQGEKLVMQAARNNYICVLDFAIGKPVYCPIGVGPERINSPKMITWLRGPT